MGTTGGGCQGGDVLGTSMWGRVGAVGDLKVGLVDHKVWTGEDLKFGAAEDLKVHVGISRWG